MVAFFGLFQKSQIFVKHLLLGERDSIDTHKLVAFFVTAPVSPGKRHHFHCFYRSGGRDMRAAAKVGEITLGIGRYMSVLEFADKLTLVFLVAVSEKFQGIGL